MTLVNTTLGVVLFVNYNNVSSYLIEGSLSDDSVYSSSIIKTTGNIKLGTSASVLDFNRTTFPIGSRIDLFVRLDNGNIARHPKGVLYVMNSTVNVEEKTLILDVGCSLAFIDDKEDSYEDAVSDLYDEFFTTTILNKYKIDQRDLATLSNILDAEGQIIYQDQHGCIQKINAFGNDGLSASTLSPKFTSFDKYTATSIESISDSAIESNISSIIVDATVDVKTDSPQTSPLGLITSQTRRTITAPNVNAIWDSNNLNGSGFVWIDADTSSTVTAEQNFDCGSLDEPAQSTTAKGSNLVVEGGGTSGNRYYPETVTSGKYQEFNGPGRQVSREESWEHCSANTFANSAISNSVNDLLQVSEAQKNDASGLIAKYNQTVDKRNEFQAVLTTTHVQQFPNGSQSSYTTTDPNPEYVYYNCLANAYRTEASNRIRVASNTILQARTYASFYDWTYGLSSLTIDTYSYGSGGQVTRKVTENWNHPLNLSYAAIGRINFGTDYYGQTANLIITNPPINRSIPTSSITNPASYDLIKFSETIVTYEYGSSYTIEREQFIDYITSSNSYTRVNYSSNGSTQAQQPNALQSEISAGGNYYCDNPTESRQLTATYNLSVTDNSINTNWFGVPEAYQKKVSFPVEFAPIKDILNTSNNSCTTVDRDSRLQVYQSTLNNYAQIAARKIAGDNMGFRVTEKLRAELFEYYPYYPIAISLAATGVAFYTRSASSNWVFDANNALCSFDCLTTSYLSNPLQPQPNIKAFTHSTDSNTTILTINLLKIGETTTSIKINTVPVSGSLYVNGNPVAVNTIISRANIAANLFTFVRSTAVTTTIAFTFTQLDNGNEILSSMYNVYPPEYSIEITAENYRADGGEFTLGTSNDGLDCDAGEFNTQLSDGGPQYMDAGNFDTGATVILPPPIDYLTCSGNNTVDVENEYGINVIDEDDNEISISTLPTVTGNGASTVGLSFIVSIRLLHVLNITATILSNAGWDYGYIDHPLDAEPLNMGTITSPNTVSINFGTIPTPFEPALSSGAV